MSVFLKIRRLLTKKHKVYLAILLVLSIILSLIETIGVSIIMPFISVASDPALLDEGRYKKIYDFFAFDSKIDFIAVFGIGIIIFYAFRSVYNVAYAYIQNSYSSGVYRYLVKKLFKICLSISYRAYVQKNTDALRQIVNGESNNVSMLLSNITQLFSEFFTVLLLYCFMIAVNWKMTLVLTAVLIVFVFIILNLVVNKNKIQGQKRTKMGQKLSRIIGESFGNFKFIKLKCNEDHITENFDTTIKMLTRSQVVNQTLGAMPRNILESIGFSLLVAVVVFIMIKYQSAERVIPIIAMYALAMYRILPSITKMINNVSQIAYCQNSLDVVYENLYQPIEEYNDFPINFKESIRIKNISFSYLSGSNVLENISLEIKKGGKIAFTGESGSGKSTLVDIITGINQPNSGTVYIDESPLTENNIRSWRKKIGYIPQTIYLFDGTVAENVSFGSDSNDEEIIKALKMAKIWDFLLTKEGLKTVVGEGGIQLSGGQKQRIGIARALYCNPEVIVLDEATSALDNETESKIMDEIYQVSEDKTLIVISHRLSTVERCEKVITMNGGRIV